MGRLVTTTLTLLLGAAVLAGCSARVSVGIKESDTIDPAKIEDAITSGLKRHTPGLRVDNVACPKGVKPAEGSTFQCTAALEGVQTPITVTVHNLNTSTGAFDYDFKPAKAIIVTDKVVKGIRSRLGDQARNAKVDCGAARLRVVEVGGAVECTVSEGSKRLVVRAVVDDIDGRAHFEQQS